MKNHFYIQQKPNYFWHFFYKEDVGICYRQMIQSKWKRYEILYKDGQADFDISIVDNDIHIGCQNNLGDIIYLVYNKKLWQKFTILKSKSKSPYPKYFKLVNIKGKLNVFYIIKHENQNLLVHHVLNKNTNEPPNVLDYVSKSSQIFKVCKDKSNNIYVSYTNASDQVQYKFYQESEDKWQNCFFNLSEDFENMESNFLIDGNDNIHFILLKEPANQGQQLIYSRKSLKDFSLNNMGMEIETIIENIKSSALETKTFLPLLLNNNTLWIIWEDNKEIFYRSSNNNGNDWHTPKKLSINKHYKPILFNLRGFNNNIIGNSAYGYIDNYNNINIYIISDYLNNKSALIPNNEDIKPEGLISNESDFKKDRQDTNTYTLKPKQDLELEKLKVMLNILQNELLEIKKLLSNFNDHSKFEEYVNMYISQYCDIEIGQIKSDLQQLMTDFELLKESQIKHINSKLEEIKANINLLKNDSNKVSFTDLINKVNKT